jgi:hypothetical protein
MAQAHTAGAVAGRVARWDSQSDSRRPELRFFPEEGFMAGEKIRTGNRAKTRVVVKRDQSDPEDVQKKPVLSPKTTDIANDRALHQDSGRPVVHVDATKATPTAVERITSGIEPVFRSIAKELIKGGIVVADSVSEFASETGEKFKDLLAEAKSELEMSKIQGEESNKTVAGTMAKS